MDPVVQLLALFLLLHVAEGALFVRRAAVTFVGYGHRFRAQQWLNGPLGTAERTVILLSPFPPFEVGHVCESGPLTIGPDAVVPVEASRAIGSSLPDADAQPIAPARLADVVAESANVRDSSGQRLAVTSSPAAARALARRLRAFGRGSPKDRQTAFEARIRAEHDVVAIRERKRNCDRVTARLAIVGPLTWVLALFTLYGVFYIQWVYLRWPWFVMAVLMLLAGLLIEIWFAHRRLYDGLILDRIMTLLLITLSIPAAVRAKAFVVRDALAEHAPVAVACALLDKTAFAQWVAPRWRDLMHPLSPEPAMCVPTLATERHALVAEWRRLIEEAGLTVSELEAPPAPDGTAQAFCPRCHAQYVVLDGHCDDCPGVRRKAFKSA